jgi:hypothetical protein
MPIRSLGSLSVIIIPLIKPTSETIISKRLSNSIGIPLIDLAGISSLKICSLFVSLISDMYKPLSYSIL